MKKLFAGALMLLILALLIYFALGYLLPMWRLRSLLTVQIPDWIDQQYIRVDGAARRGVKLEGLKNIVIHYVGNPGTTAQQNRDYFDSPATQVSAHFLVGLDGEIIQCIPLTEKCSASNHRNRDTIAIEVCHSDDTGRFNPKTYRSLVQLTAWLCGVCDLRSEDVIRHYDITGKLCPIYYVKNPKAWETFQKDVAEAQNQG